MNARRLIVAMPKGGSGKTATAVAFAWGLQRAGKRVLLIDLDPQGNATGAMGASAGRYAALEVLLRLGERFDPVRVNDGLDLVPASPWRAGVDIEIQKANQVTGPIAVREAIERVEAFYDYVICDCPPSLGPLTYNALAAGPILAPVEMTRLAVSVVPELDQVVATLRRGVAPDARVLAYLPTREVAEQLESREALLALRAIEADRVLSTRIPQATAIARSLAEATSPFVDRFRRSKGPAAYLAAIHEVTTLLEAQHGQRNEAIDRGDAHGEGGRRGR
jgi:chromosome partitioning protein